MISWPERLVIELSSTVFKMHGYCVVKKILFLFLSLALLLSSSCYSTKRLPVPVGAGLYYCEGCAVLIPGECVQGGEGWHIASKAATC